jgi:toxin ParE1/3/4
MKSLPYIISKEAIADLDEIWHYTVETWSVDQANRYYDLILQEIEYICKAPNSGKPLDDIRKGYRVSKVKSHLVFYRIANQTIEIIRILHRQMDVENRLND